MALPVTVPGSATLYTVFYTAVLTHSIVSGRICTNQILDPMNQYDPDRLVPLLGRYESSGTEQWIFPDLQFTCSGQLTKWIFRGVSGQSVPCSVQLETWRLDTTITFNTAYERLSTTVGNTESITIRGPIFTYELISPVPVQPGDIVGVELGLPCPENVLSLNISGQGSNFSGYRRQMSGSSFFLQSSSTFTEQDCIPLIEAVVEQEPTGGVTTTPEADQSGGTATITIIAAVVGSIVGVLVIVIACVCGWCIARHVHIQISYNKERRQSDTSKQQQNDSNVIPVQQNAANRSTPHDREPTAYHAMMEVPEQAMQLNLAYGLQGATREAIETESSRGEYERMYAANHHGNFVPIIRGLDKRSNLAVPRRYKVPTQQLEANTDNNEYQYECIL